MARILRLRSGSFWFFRAKVFLSVKTGVPERNDFLAAGVESPFVTTQISIGDGQTSTNYHYFSGLQWRSQSFWFLYILKFLTNPFEKPFVPYISSISLIYRLKILPTIVLKLTVTPKTGKMTITMFMNMRIRCLQKCHFYLIQKTLYFSSSVTIGNTKVIFSQRWSNQSLVRR